MNAARDNDALAAAESYLAWWKLAGVDVDYVTDAAAWLDADSDAVSTENATGKPNQSAKKPVSGATRKAPQPQTAPEFPPLPPNHAEFLTYWMKEPRLALASGTGRRVAPHGPLEPRLMVIADMPDSDDMQILFSGAAGGLLKNIFRAAGIDPQTVYHAALLPEASLEPRIDPAILAAYGKILNGHIGLVRPQNIILLGNMPNSALTGNDLTNNRLNLRIINHELGDIAAASSFHPRTLIQRPALKARAWQDWQWLMENMK